jgi:hypothetical protein
VGFDSHEHIAEVHEDRNMEDSVGIKVQVLDVVVPEETFEEVTGWHC